MALGQFHKTAKQGLSSFLSEKFTLIPYLKILSSILRYFIKLTPGTFRLENGNIPGIFTSVLL